MMEDKMKDLEGFEYLNAGCGTVRFDNCINMDIAENDFVDADIIGSVLNIPFPAERFKGVFFAHVLEHLMKEEHLQAFMEIRRVLKPEGIVYIEVPDFELAIKYWQENRRGRRDYWYQCIYGRSAYFGDQHKSGITEQYLTDLLFDTGFCHLRWLDLEKEEALIALIATKGSLPEQKL